MPKQELPKVSNNEVMNNAKNPYQEVGLNHTDEIDLIELWQAIWTQKLKVVCVTSVFAVLSVVFALSRPDMYMSEALLAPAKEEKKGGLAGLAGQFGGLASLAGVDLGGSSGGSTEEALAILQSRDFITRFVRENDLLIPLFAMQPTSFSKEIKIDPEVYDETSKTWLREVKAPYTAEPTNWEIYKAFSRILNVATDKTTGLITVSIEWYDAEKAQQWVTLLIGSINQYLKKRDVDEAKRSIEFIKEKMQQVNLIDIQTIFYGLIKAHGETIMLAEVRDEYAFRTIDPAVVPLEKSQPKRALICVLGTLLGGMLGVLWALVSHFVSNRVRQS